VWPPETPGTEAANSVGRKCANCGSQGAPRVLVRFTRPHSFGSALTKNQFQTSVCQVIRGRPIIPAFLFLPLLFTGRGGGWPGLGRVGVTPTSLCCSSDLLAKVLVGWEGYRDWCGITGKHGARKRNSGADGHDSGWLILISGVWPACRPTGPMDNA